MRYPPKIKLDNGHEFIIKPEVYNAIVEMVATALVCYSCGFPYTPDRPRVGENLCLPCYRRRWDVHSLQYLGLYKADALDETHKFMDDRGMIYLSSTTSRTSVENLGCF